MDTIKVNNLSFSYGKRKILEDVSFSCCEGEVVAFTGVSGCGKSTLMYILSGIIPRSIERNYTGEVEILGQNILKLKLADIVKNIGIVFQNPDSQLFAPTICDEIAFVLENLQIPHHEMEKKVDDVLELVGMAKYKEASPQMLSGGEKQLIALASVLVQDPKILILDEAMSQLDADSTDKIKEVILALKNQGKTIVMVEHDKDNFDVVDRLLTIENGKLCDVEVSNEK